MLEATNPMASFVTKAVRSANGELIDDFQKIAKKADPKLSFFFCGESVVFVSFRFYLEKRGLI